MTDDKNYIIDPLTCLCKIALLSFMPEKSKIAIGHHVLNLQTFSYYQWFERMKNGDSRIDISNLNAPFIKAIKWYIVDNPNKTEMDEDMEESIKIITNFTIKGLIKLQNSTYHSDKAIKIILQYFINILQNALDGTLNDDTCVMADGNNRILSDKIKNNFEAHTFNSIAKMLNDASHENSPDNINVLIDCVHKLLINRDTDFVNMMKEINTTL